MYGLSACTTGNGCFRKVNQSGATSPLPRSDAQWGQETAIDVDMVSAICPNCKILVVEANSRNIADLAASVNTAVNLGAFAVSNSYGTAETGLGGYAAFYNHPGVVITAG